MKLQNTILLILPLFITVGCAQTSLVKLEESRQFAPPDNVLILEHVPDEPFEIIARLETRGTAFQSIPPLLNQMRNEASKIGADAIIPVEERQEQIQQQVMYNPWLGGYQTLGGGSAPIVTSYAIIFENNISQRMAAYRAEPLVNGGLSFNLVAPVLSGYGFSGWIGKNRFRVAADYYSFNIPEAMLRDGFTEGKIDNGFRLSFDYFLTGNLSGPYVGVGFQYASYSSGHENSRHRGSWESFDLSGSFGYMLKLHKNIHVDARLAIDAALYGEESIMVGSYQMVPDDVGVYALIGIGVNF